jgi:hypothetical protein
VVLVTWPETPLSTTWFGCKCDARCSSHAYLVSGCVAFNCFMSFIIAESIPIFDDLLSVIGALLGSFLCMQVPQTYLKSFADVPVLPKL